MEDFLAVNKKYFRNGLKSIDILIISQIEEFERNDCKCFISNEQFSEMFGESVSTIKRTLDKLEDLKIIKRTNSYIEGNGRSNKQRVLSLTNRSKWKVHNEPTNGRMEGSNNNNGRFKNEEWKVHNEPLKDNLKNNLKENLSKRENANAKKENHNRVLEDLSDEELISIKPDYINKVKYRDTQKRLNLSCNVTKDTWREAENILAQRDKERKSDQNKSVLSKFGLTVSEGDELAEKLTDCSWSAWGECAEDVLNNYLAASNMTTQELLSYLRNNELATRQIYEEYVPKSIWDSREKFYPDYEDYLKDYVKNTDDVVCFVEDKMTEKNLYGII